jgi:hypothetical protein
MVVALALGGCLLIQPNPEARRCAAACLEQKNRCLVAATTAAAVSACDASHRACDQPCQALPRDVWR